jgi:hypothetical protein
MDLPAMARERASGLDHGHIVGYQDSAGGDQRSGGGRLAGALGSHQCDRPAAYVYNIRMQDKTLPQLQYVAHHRAGDQGYHIGLGNAV